MRERRTIMGYDLTWVEDPKEELRDAVFKSVLAAANLPGSPAENIARAFSAACRAAETIGGYFRTSQASMSAILAEMDAQGMLDRAPEVGEKLSAQSGTITRDEI